MCDAPPKMYLLGVTLLTWAGVASAQHHVRVPQGPLLRTEGSSVSLWCNASDSAVGGFEWSAFLSHSPSVKLQILSSSDPHFTYAMYRERLTVRREIYLERVRRDSSRLHITRLRAWDAGEYECHTPNTAHTYYGTYSASVRLTVIPDLLRVTNLSPEEVSAEEYDPLTLDCEVFSSSRHHTHFSITWFQKDREAILPILSHSRNAVVSAGPMFERRHKAGEIRLEKVSTTWYQLRLSSIHHTDQAEYYCQATEWIQDPDESWYPLTTKRSRVTKFRLRSQDVMAEVHSSSYSGTPAQTGPVLLTLLLLFSWTWY